MVKEARILERLIERKERTLERSQYLSTGEVLDRYGVAPQKLEAWRDRSEPPFPPPIEVRWQDDLFFHLLHLVGWEVSRPRLRRVLQ